MAPPKKNNKESAVGWTCSLRTIQIMEAAGVDCSSDEAVVKWYDGLGEASRRRVKATFSEKIEDARARMGGGKTTRLPKPTAFMTLEELADFERNYVSSRSAQDALNDMRRERAFWLAVINNAKKRGDEHAISHASKQFTLYDASLHKAELRALKQGLETGEVLSRAEHERIIAAWAFWAMRAIDAALPALCRKCVGLADAGEARAVLESALLSRGYFEPFVQASKLSTGNALPHWWVEKLTDAVDDFIENGRALIDQEASRPLAASA